MTRLLFASDAPQPPEYLLRTLDHAGFTVDHAATPTAAGVRVRHQAPDVVVLHLHAPCAHAVRAIARLRSAYEGPILVLAQTSPEADEIHALELGADDYVVLPAHPRRVALRVKAIMRRNRRITTPVRFRDGALHVDAARGIARVHHIDVPLTSGEFRLLLMLVHKAGEPLSREAYFQATTGQSYNGIDRIMDVRMSYLRRKLAAAGLPMRRIRSVRGVGYQLNLEEAPPQLVRIEGSIASK